jgi:hypothetical protein
MSKQLTETISLDREYACVFIDEIGTDARESGGGGVCGQW